MKFIFKVHMFTGHTVDEYAEGWVQASEIMQRTPGARGTYLHRMIGDPSVALAIAHWDSKEARDRKNDRAHPLVREILERHKGICRIELIGEFDEPEWEVLPGRS